MTSKNDKTKEDRWNRFGKKGKGNTSIKTKDTTRGNKPEDTGERRKTKKMIIIKQYRQKKDIPKQGKNLPANRG